MSGEQRIGNAERTAAVDALKQHLTAGRLSSAEYEDRSVTARQARTRADLDALFDDLPEPHPRPANPGSTGSRTEPATAVPSPLADGPEPPAPIGPPAVPARDQRGSSWLPEPYAYTVCALSPFAAVILFFVTDQWLWFLLIPIVGTVVYGPHKDDHKKQRKRDRNRRR